MVNIMNQKHLIYALFPFIAGLALKRLIFSDNETITYLSCVGISCVLSLVVYAKLILPSIENQFGTYSSLKKMNELNSKYGMNSNEIDIANSMSDIDNEEQQKQLKGYANIAWFHVLLLIGLIAFYFLK